MFGMFENHFCKKLTRYFPVRTPSDYEHVELIIPGDDLEGQIHLELIKCKMELFFERVPGGEFKKLMNGSFFGRIPSLGNIVGRNKYLFTRKKIEPGYFVVELTFQKTGTSKEIHWGSIFLGLGIQGQHTTKDGDIQGERIRLFWWLAHKQEYPLWESFCGIMKKEINEIILKNWVGGFFPEHGQISEKSIESA